MTEGYRIKTELDENVREELDGLTKDQFYERYDPSGSRLMNYGVDSLAHAFVMNRAQEKLVSGKMSLERFCNETGITPTTKDDGLGTRGLILWKSDPLREAGIYVPKYRMDHEGKHLFAGDYNNGFGLYEAVDPSISEEWADAPILERKRVIGEENYPIDQLSNESFVNRGKKYARDLWKVAHFEHMLDSNQLGEEDIVGDCTMAEITKNEIKKGKYQSLGESEQETMNKLAGYYQSVIEELTGSSLKKGLEMGVSIS